MSSHEFFFQGSLDLALHKFSLVFNQPSKLYLKSVTIPFSRYLDQNIILSSHAPGN